MKAKGVKTKVAPINSAMVGFFVMGDSGEVENVLKSAYSLRGDLVSPVPEPNENVGLALLRLGLLGLGYLVMLCTRASGRSPHFALFAVLPLLWLPSAVFKVKSTSSYPLPLLWGGDLLGIELLFANSTFPPSFGQTVRASLRDVLHFSVSTIGV